MAFEAVSMKSKSAERGRRLKVGSGAIEFIANDCHTC